MSILLADIDATCSGLGYHDGSKYYMEEDALQSLKHLIWILRRDSLDSHEYRRYIGHKKVVQTDLLPMLINNCDNPELSDVLLRLLVNLTNPALLFFRSELPKDHAGRRTYLDLMEISHTYKEAFVKNSDIWSALAARLQKIMEIDVSMRMEEQSLVLERILVLIRNVLQVPANPQHEKIVDNDISVHDQILWALHGSGLLELILYILSSQYENQYYLHALEITFLIFREQNVETLADSSVQRSTAEKHADEQALITARRLEAAKKLQNIPSARHSRFGGTYVYRNVKSVSDRDLICHKPLERILEQDFSRDKKKIKLSFRIIRDEEKYERQSAFCIRLFLREFCIEILTSAFNNLIRQVRRVLERNHVNNEGSGHDQSYLLWAIRFFLEFNRLNGFKLDLVSEALSTGCIHWICNQIQHDAEMIQTDKKKKINWNRRLQLGLQAYREFLQSVQAMETLDDDDIKALVAKLKSNIFYVVEYREIILQLLLSYNENHFTRMFVRDLIDTTNVYLQMIEKYCQGSIMVQSKVKSKQPKKPSKVKAPKEKVKKIKEKKKKPSPEEVMEKYENDWDSKISSNLSVVLANEINLPEDDHPRIPFQGDDVVEDSSDKTLDEIRESCMQQIHMYLRSEDFERAVLLMRLGRKEWSDTEKFGSQSAQPEEELMLLKEIYLNADLCKNVNAENDFWKEFESSDESEEEQQGKEDNENGDESDDEEEVEDEEEEEETVMKEVVMNFSDIEKRLLNPKVVRACTWALQSWEQMNYREIKSIVRVLHRIAINLNFPIMLMQAQLFRIFQQVFNTPRDTRYEEIRRLGIFIVRRFVSIAPKNPKIFAELLFFKSHRECYEIENGYEEQSVAGYDKGKNKIWTEEQEDELRGLYMQNQESPQTENDVIDWIVENLTEKSRTRRAVIKKLKELGLIFKAPTKKSNAAAANRNLFIKDEDDKLRELYDEHRLNEDCLKIIMEVFDKKRTRKAVVCRMVQLGLIADESEIMPISEKKGESNHYSSSSEDDYFDRNGPSEARYARKTTNLSAVSHYEMNNREVSSFRIELEEALKEPIEWIVESLNEAAEDFEEPSDELSDAIPLVPVSQSHKLAMENPQFQGLLRSVNLIEPHDGESFWKIPANMMPHELKKRAQLLTGEISNENESAVEGKENNAMTESDNDDDDSDLFSRLRAQREALIYNKSDDNEDSHSTVSTKTKQKNEKKKKKPQKTYSESESENDEIVMKRKKNKKKPEIPKELSDEFAINTQELKERLAELESSDDNEDKISQQNSPKKASRNALESSDDEEILSTSTTKRRMSEKRERSLSSTNENEMNISNNQMKKIRRIIDSDEDD